MISITASKPDIVARMLARMVTRWVHSTGTTPRKDGYSPDAECIEAAAEIERLRAMLSMPRLMHACDALGAPADGSHCELLRRALLGEALACSAESKT